MMEGMSEDLWLDDSRESTDHVGVDSSFLTSMRSDVDKLRLNETGIDNRKEQTCGLMALIAAIILHEVHESGSNLEVVQVSSPSDMEPTSGSYRA